MGEEEGEEEEESGARCLRRKCGEAEATGAAPREEALAVPREEEAHAVPEREGALAVPKREGEEGPCGHESSSPRARSRVQRGGGRGRRAWGSSSSEAG